jgi:glyoxylase-like metal-dependent hydrolase (beta-lactamase superfamily II)
VRIGEIELVPLLDARGSIGRMETMYPSVPPHAWEPYRALYPELFDDQSWRPPNHCYLVRSGGQTILVDTGLGEYELLDVVETAGGLLPALAAQGVSPSEIDLVFITHVHIDHVGTNRAFPEARFAMHRDAVAAAEERASERAHIPETVLPLLEAGRVDAIEDGAELAPGVVAVALDGHDQGHTGVRLGSEAFLIADAAAHPALLAHPEWPFAADVDHDRAVATRQAIVEEALDTDLLVVSGHFPGNGIGRLMRTADGRALWQEARQD